MAGICPTAGCAFSSPSLLALAEHQGHSKVGGPWACQSYTCGAVFCTKEALGEHMQTCPDFQAWNATRKNGTTMNATQTRTARLRAHEIASGTLGTGGTWNSRKKGMNGGFKKLNSSPSTSSSCNTATQSGVTSQTSTAANTPAAPRPKRIAKQTGKEENETNGTETAPSTHSRRLSKRKVQETKLNADGVEPKTARKLFTHQRSAKISRSDPAAAMSLDHEVGQNDGEMQSGDLAPGQNSDDDDTARLDHPSHSAASFRDSTTDQSPSDKIAKPDDMFTGDHCCSFCTNQFSTYSTAAQHVGISNAPPRYKCPACRFTICTHQQLSEHITNCENFESWAKSDGALSHPDLEDYTKFEDIRLVSATKDAQLIQHKVFMANAQETAEQVEDRKMNQSAATPSPEVAEIVSLSWNQSVKIRARHGIR